MCVGNNKVMSLLSFIWVVLLLVNVLLIQENKKLKVLASRPDRALELKPGTALPPLEGIDSHGNRQSISYGQDSRKTVLLVLSPRCRACNENMPNWTAIIKGLDQQSFRLAAISLQPGGIEEYAGHYGISQVPIITEIDPKYKIAYHLGLTPQTILIGSDGKAEKVWTGLLQSEAKQDIEQALKIRLP